MEEIRQSVLRHDNAAIMRRVVDGESVVVTVHGWPGADLVPHQRGGGWSRFVGVAALGSAIAALPQPDPTAWAHDQAQARFDDELPDPFTATTRDRPPTEARGAGRDGLR